MNKIFRTFVVLCSAVISAQAQDGPDAFYLEEPDHLEPLSNYGIFDHRSRQLIETDYLKADEYIMAEFMKFSYCEPQTITSLIKNNTDSNTRLVHIFLQPPSEQSSTAKPLLKTRSIDSDLAQDIKNLFQMVVSETRYGKDTMAAIGLDCISQNQFYVLYSKYDNFLTKHMYGETSIPPKGTPPDHLIQMSESMMSYTKEIIDEEQLKKSLKQNTESVSKYRSTKVNNK